MNLATLSLEQQVALLPDEEREAILDGLDPEELLYDWKWGARPQQYLDPFDESWAVALLLAGRGSGKTRGTTEWVRDMDQCWDRMPERHGMGADHLLRGALLSRTAADVRDTLINGPSGLLHIYPPSQQDMIAWIPSRRLLVLPNGSEWLTFCADPETEVMTRTGWRHYSQIGMGTEILTLNHETGQSEWQPTEAVHTFDVTDEPMVRTQTWSHSSFVTLNHRWPTVHCETGRRIWRESMLALNSKDTLVAAAPALVPDSPAYSDDFVSLVGWYTTEGWLGERTNRQRTSVTLCQSVERNPEKVAEIERILTSLYGPPVTTLLGHRRPAWRATEVNPSNGCVYFHLNHEISVELQEVAPGKDKVVDLGFIQTLTARQLAIFLEAVTAGDGHLRAKTVVITQAVPGRLDAIELAAILSGYAVRRSSREFTTRGTVFPQEELMWTWGQNAHPRPLNAHGVDHRTQESYTGTVWCPQTQNRTWLARRNGTVYYTGNSAEEPDQLRGPAFHFGVADELAAYKGKVGADGLSAWDNLRIASRIGRTPQIVAATTPKRVPLMRRLVAESADPTKKILLRKMRTMDNPYLSEAYLDVLSGLYGGTTLGAQELDGEMLDEVEGAMVKTSDIDDQRVTVCPDIMTNNWYRILAVDPSVAEKPTDECGIMLIAAPKVFPVHRRHAFVVEDYSLHASPAIWAERVARMAVLHDAMIVVESNQGGAMAKLLIEQTAAQLELPKPVIRMVWASTNKKARAEPIAAAYEKKRIHHVNFLPEYETQLVEWTPDSGYSPDRMDAAVWGLAACLFPEVLKGGLAGSVAMSANRMRRRVLTSQTQAVRAGGRRR